MTKIKIFLLTSLALLLSACTLETDNDAGDLEGMWHLVRIENLVTGSGGSVKDLSSQKVFWSFQARLLELDDKSGGGSSYLYRFQIDNGQLTLKDLIYMIEKMVTGYSQSMIVILKFMG